MLYQLSYTSEFSDSVVPPGFEPGRLSTTDFKSTASTDSSQGTKFELTTGIEPACSSLPKRCLTTRLHQHVVRFHILGLAPTLVVIYQIIRTSLFRQLRLLFRHRFMFSHQPGSIVTCVQWSRELDLNQRIPVLQTGPLTAWVSRHCDHLIGGGLEDESPAAAFNFRATL